MSCAFCVSFFLFVKILRETISLMYRNMFFLKKYVFRLFSSIVQTFTVIWFNQLFFLQNIYFIWKKMWLSNYILHLNYIQYYVLTSHFKMTFFKNIFCGSFFLMEKNIWKWGRNKIQYPKLIKLVHLYFTF